MQVENYSTDYVYTEYDSFLKAYYDNLTENLGFNHKGTCGYVGIGMLLSYYDTYINDNIIPEKYDMASTGTETNMIVRGNSPGTLNDYREKGETLPSRGYYNNMVEIANRENNPSLHAKLITIGNSLGYCSLGAEGIVTT